VAAVGVLAGAFLLKFSPVRAVLASVAGLLVADDWVKWQTKGEGVLAKLTAAAKQFWYTFNGAFDEKSKNELDKKTNPFLRYKEEIKNGLGFLDYVFSGDLPKDSKVKKRTNIKQYKSDLIKQGYSEQNAQARIDFLKENGAIGEDGYIKNNVNLNLKSPKEEAANELRNNVNLNLKSPKEEAANELRNKREMQNRNFNAQRAAANPSGYNNTQSSSTTTNSTNVGQVIINTQASDARGVYNEFVNRVLVNQAESGGF